MQNFISKIPLGNNKFAYEQSPEFRVLGTQHKSLIESKWSPPKHFFHVRKGGHVAALRKHTPNHYFSKIDLSRFYYRVTKNKIIRSLKKIGLSYASSAEIAAESVVKTEAGFALPYGFIQSPLLSSIAMEQSGLGSFLASIPTSVVVTVYVDDILLSSYEDEDQLTKTTNSLVEIAEASGFPINMEKSEFTSEAVTSFNVKLRNQSLTLTDERMDQFREFLRLSPTDFQVEGVLNYVEQINETQLKQLIDYLQV